MSVRNRELSQFGSFIYIDDSTKTIGIATTASPNVGIGTTNARHKLSVVGNTNISGNANVTGIISATSYYLNGSPLVSAEVSSWVTSGSDIYRLNGNVGVGSTIPQSKLDVIGDIKATGTITGSNINLTGFSVASGIVTALRFNSTVATGTAPLTVASQTLVTNLNADYLRGKVSPSGDIVGTTDSQTLTTKTINLSNNTLSGTIAQFNTALSDADFATLTGSEILTNKTLTSPVISSISNSGTQTIPTGTGTLVSTNSVGVVTTGMIADGTITNSDIATGAAIDVSKLASSTISGISLGSNLNNLTAGSFINYNSGITYNGSTAITVSVAATTANTSNTVVARNGSGDFTAGTITCANANATFNLQGDTLLVNKISAGSTVGTAGSVLTSTGSGLQWTSVVGGGSSITVINDISTDTTYYVGYSTVTSGIITTFGVSSSRLQFNPSTGNLSATVFTSLSDATQKKDIKPIENPVELTKQLQGVRFNWIDNNKPSLGLIAQEVEKVLPEMIETNEDGLKRVNYSNMIGLLIEAIKEQQVRIEELERKLNA